MNDFEENRTIDILPGLSILGAGPGDPELLTMKAHSRLGSAAVVLYDNLANANLLDLTPSGCEHVYVGKRAYGDYTPQDEIHELIRNHSPKGLVIRLKGGDPYIFGRGFEELLFAKKIGLRVEYIPGISAMQGFGMYDIPLTFRGMSESVWILTGTKKDLELSKDLQLAMQSNATIVIYMGLKKIQAISDVYCLAGKGNTPAALLQNATLPESKFIQCDIAELPQRARENDFSYPSIMILGRVAGLTTGSKNPAFQAFCL